mgnify:CR=1 FL=1|jgi:hypothetical protein
MPIYLEYDKITKKIKKVLNADVLPQDIAYLSYQEIPEGISIDLSMNIDEIVNVIMEYKVQQQEQKKDENIQENPVVIEV